MAATVYLHVGTMKTGSSALQSFLVQNTRVLEKYGYCFPKTLRGGESVFANRNGHFLVYQSETGDQKEIEEVRRRGFEIIEEKLKQFDRIILTDEAIWLRSTQIPDFWKKLTARFRKMGCDLKIIVYLRRQDMLIESLWNQAIKSYFRSTVRFQEWVSEKRYAYYPLNYYGNLMRIAQYTGKNNILVRVYEKQQFEGEEHTIFSDFFHTIGLVLNEEYDYALSHLSSNNGLRGNFIEMKRLVNGIPEYREHSDFLRRPFLFASDCANNDPNNSGLQMSMFSREEKERLMKIYEDGNRNVAVEFMGRDDGVFFLEDPEDLPEWKWNQEEVWRDLLFLMTESFCAQEKKNSDMQETIKRMRTEMNSFKASAEQRIQSLESEMESVYNSSIFRGYRKVRRIMKKQ